jgi:hypothetical protein
MGDGESSLTPGGGEVGGGGLVEHDALGHGEGHGVAVAAAHGRGKGRGRALTSGAGVGRMKWSMGHGGIGCWAGLGKRRTGRAQEE